MTGIICLNKPEGITSFQAVRQLRAITGEKKAGHCGTLDPLATGVLPVMLGGATRFLEYLPTTPKAYRAALKLGVRTDTLDRTGTVLEERDVTVSRDDLLAALDGFRGDQLQVPPMYSALKKDGVRLYDLARKGEDVAREPRPVSIYKLDLLPDGTDGTDPAAGEYVLDVSCSGGTYIRSLIDDLGTALGCGAVMTALQRTQVGVFSLEDAVTIPELEAARDNGTLPSLLRPVDETMTFLDAVTVTDPQAVRFRNGGALALDRLPLRSGPYPEETLFRVYDKERHFLGLGAVSPEAEELAVRRVFVNR
ncbi:MAG: tRNA pseudouridine(55) synthase TruB [Clostridia bacterium]|nr:tRNA pseudouridine(55) synthase TruB [Clostridia bacterium]